MAQVNTDILIFNFCVEVENHFIQEFKNQAKSSNYIFLEFTDLKFKENIDKYFKDFSSKMEFSDARAIRSSFFEKYRAGYSETIKKFLDTVPKLSEFRISEGNFLGVRCSIVLK